MTQFRIAFNAKETGDTGYLTQNYRGSEYSLLKGHYRIKNGRGPGRLFTVEEATLFDGDQAIEILTLIANRFPASVECWAEKFRIEIAN